MRPSARHRMLMSTRDRVLRSARDRRHAPCARSENGRIRAGAMLITSPRRTQEVSSPMPNQFTYSSLEERLLANIVKTDTCWLWARRLSRDGYAKMKAAGKKTGAHRIAYELFVSPIPEGLTIDHLCRVRHCVNPAHLEPVTLRENILRSDNAAAIHARKIHCPRGHAYDEPNTKWYKNRRQCRICIRAWNRLYMQRKRSQGIQMPDQRDTCRSCRHAPSRHREGVCIAQLHPIENRERCRCVRYR